MARSTGKDITQQATHTETKAPLWKRLVWMAGIWLASVTFLGVIAWVIRSWLKV